MQPQVQMGKQRNVCVSVSVSVSVCVRVCVRAGMCVCVGESVNCEIEQTEALGPASN